MAKTEKTKENTQRILDIQELVRQKKKNMDDFEFSMNDCHRSVDKLLGELEKARNNLESVQAEYDTAVNRLKITQDSFERDSREVKALKTELEELLTPYNDQLAEMKAAIDAEETRHFEQLKASMTELGWTEECCRDAARTFVKSQPEWTWHEECRLLLERVEKCEYTSQMELRVGILASNLAMP